MTTMENDKCCISGLIETLVSPVKILSKIHLFIRLSKSENYICNHFQKGEVDEDLLLRLFKKSVHCNSIKQLLPDILYHVDAHSISDAVVEFSITYPGEFRETLLSLLAHMWLSVEQLELINNYIHTPEAFCKLFFIYAEDTLYPEEKFEQFLLDNKHYLMDVDCIALIYKQHIIVSESKLILLKHFISDEPSINQ